MNTQPEKRSAWRRIQSWFHRNPRRMWILVIVGLLLLSGMVTFAIWYQPPKPAPVTKKATPKPVPPKKYYSPLTGLEVPNEAATTQAVNGILIENSTDARPQSGLKEAGVVYEAIAEGGITRFLALYQQEKPALIGPVRSLRMYYLDWAAPYNASIAHFGGSAASLAEASNGSYRDLDLMKIGGGWRVNDRVAPHNVYTNFENLDKLNNERNYTQSSFKSFPRQDGKPSETPTVTSFYINFGSPAYNTSYAYDTQTNTYARSVGGAAHDDREKGRITPSVVVAMQVEMTRIMEDGYRESIATNSSGKAVVFQNGTATEATWRKQDRTSPLEIVTADGTPLALNRGQTWIAAFPSGRGAAGW